MQKKINKILIFGFLSLVLSGMFFVYKIYYQNNNDLKVIFLDVGQGDAILIKTPQKKNILIDGGPNQQVINAMSRQMAWYDRKIDLMILSHPHDDHVAGLVEVVKRYEVKKVIATGIDHAAPSYLEWLWQIENKNIPLLIMEEKQILVLENDCYLDFFYPTESLLNQKVRNLNSSSLVFKLLCNNSSFLFSGDAEADVEKELLAMEIDLQADVFKVAHHGSHSSNTEDLLIAINPQYGVIQSGEGNKFNHPHLGVLNRLKRLNIETLRNDYLGDIVFIANGQELYWR